MSLRRSLSLALLTAGTVAVASSAAVAAPSAEDDTRRVDRTGAPLNGTRQKDAKRGTAVERLLMGPIMSGHYEPLETITTGSWPENVAVGDVTGDGRADVLLTTSYYFDEANDYKLFVYSQRPDGSLRPEVKYQTRMAYGDTGGLAVLDANRDGRLDVAVTTASGVELFAQNTAGSLESRGVLAGSPAKASQLTAADLDGDGDSDLLVAGRAGIVQLTQGDDGTFARLPVTTESTTVARVGDLDGDGRPDAVGFRGFFVTVYRNLGEYWRREVPLVRDVSVNGVEVADVTADGRADLLVTEGGNRPDSQLVVFPQSDAGTLAKPIAYPVMDIPQPVRAADIDGDGRNDVVMVHSGWELVSTLVQRTDGTLAEAGFDQVPYASNYNGDALAVGDVNGDGRADVVIADYNHGAVILRNAG
ncbi:VCBS repeat-containing protein [Actinomycetes bacterium KLBMP 9797]